MKKILTSKWFALGVGMVLFLVVLLLSSAPGEADSAAGAHEGEGETSTNELAAVEHEEVDSPLHKAEQPIVAPPPLTPLPITQVGDPGSLRFNNPDIQQLVDELQQERQKLRDWETELEELRKRLELDKMSLGTITQKFLQAKADLEHTLTNQLTMTETREQKQLRDLSVVYTNMPPASAVEILSSMDANDVARILQYMWPAQMASILENFATNKTLLSYEEGKATTISEKIRRLSEVPAIPK